MSTLSKKRQSLLPGETGRTVGLLSGFILLLAVLPILTMIVMSSAARRTWTFRRAATACNGIGPPGTPSYRRMPAMC